jgi:hypothetical protein
MSDLFFIFMGLAIVGLAACVVAIAALKAASDADDQAEAELRRRQKGGRS